MNSFNFSLKGGVMLFQARHNHIQKFICQKSSFSSLQTAALVNSQNMRSMFAICRKTIGSNADIPLQAVCSSHQARIDRSPIACNIPMLAVSKDDSPAISADNSFEKAL